MMELRSPIGFSDFGFSYISLKQLNRKFGVLRSSRSVVNCRKLQWAGNVVWSEETRNT